MRTVLICLIFVCSGFEALSQNKEVLKNFSEYFKNANTAYKKREFRLAMDYLDSSLLYHGQDSLEVLYNHIRRANCYDWLNTLDSSFYFLRVAENIGNQIAEKFALSGVLMQKGFLYQRTKDLSESNRNLLECINITNVNMPDGAFILAWCYRMLIHNQISLKQLDSTYYLLTKMDKYAILDSTGRVFPETLNTKAAYYYAIGDHYKALDFLYKKYQLSHGSIENVTVNNSNDLSNIALIYGELGDYSRAIKYHLAVDQAHRNEHRTLEREFYDNLKKLSESYRYEGSYDMALNAIEEHLQVYKTINPQYKDAYYYSSLVRKARVLSDLGNHDLSIQILKNCLNFFDKIPDNIGYLIDVYSNVGIAYVGNGDYTKGLSYLQQALILQKNLEGIKQNLASAYSNLGWAYQEMGMNRTSIVFLDSATWVNQDYTLFDSSNLHHISNVRTQMDYLHSKLYNYKIMWQDEKIEDDLMSAISIINETNIVLNHARKLIRSDENRLNISLDFYQYAVYFFYEKYLISKDSKDLLKSFSFSEFNKSFLLNDIANESSRRFDKKYELFLAEKDFYKQELRVALLQNELADQVIYYEKLDSIQKIIDEYTAYDPFNYIKISDLHDAVGDKALLSFHIGMDELYAFLYVDGELRIDKFPFDSNFKDQIIRYRSALSNPSEDIPTLYFENDLMSFLKPYEENQIIIIPDGVLNYIPFETLNVNDSSRSLLMEVSNVRYVNSYKDLLLSVKTNSFKSSLLSFAPEFENSVFLETNDIVRDQLVKLSGAMEEVVTITEIFSGKSFVSSDATEESFIRNASDYGLIHLATHALVDDLYPEKSKLVFNVPQDSINDGYLHAYEIYNLDLNAQLVTLSACNTGFGKIRKGEGVMSLSRAFAYAGVPATVVSLWPASDKSTPELMKHFYQNLKDGQAKDEALNNARKQYLATAKGKARHPFYWGGFVLIGDNSPVVKNRPVWLWIIPFMLLALILSVLYLRKTKSVKALG